ncbi:MAG: DnaD domain protein [Clostridiales bacterium]|nr:DnaD domain protein [Clostridiales bacterium]
MPKIQLICDDICTDTAVPNCFIDEYMPAANGEFVKVYLYLLRNAKSHASDCTISAIADHFNQTEKDVLRALHYWQCRGLLSIKADPDGGACSIRFLRPQPIAKDEEEIPLSELLGDASDAQDGAAEAPAEAETPQANVTPIQIVPRTYTADERAEFQKDSTIREIIFLAESYLKHPLSESEMNTIIFWHVDLKFAPELIDYLLQYCISKGHSSIRYMDKVAQGWHDAGIATAEQAKEEAAIHSRAYYGVMKAMGITGRSLVSSETAFIKKWTKDYGFDLPIIQNACERTIAATHQPSFEYTDSILTSWHDKGVHTLSDIQSLDSAHQKAKKSAARANDLPAKRNAFTNFNQRSYDYDKLEELLLNTSLHG